MRYVILVVLAALAAWYFTTGIRLGIVTGGTVTMFNANGTSKYPFKTDGPNQQVGVTGSCNVQKGSITLRLLDSRGTQVAGQQCPKGNWSFNLMSSGEVGEYNVEVQYHAFTGKLTLNETRKGY